jgi:FtsZ-interacting cell division protein ZipA
MENQGTGTTKGETMELKRELIITAVIALVIGLIVGYMFWGGKKEEKTGLKQVLLRAVEKVDEIEKEKKSLQDELNRREDNTEQVAALSGEIEAMKEKIREAEAVTQTHDELKAAIAALEKENQVLTVKLGQISTISGSQGEPPGEEIQQEAPEQEGQ